jgi:hypothetical protein
MLLYQYNTGGYGRVVWILNSSDGGINFDIQSLTYPSYDTNPCGLAQSPLDGTWTAIYWRNDYFYVVNSFNNGESWSIETKLDTVNGIGAVSSSTPYDGKFVRMLQIQYDSTGILHGYMVYNKTRIYTLQSNDNGLNWENMTEFRSYQSNIFDLKFLKLSDNIDAIAFRSDFSGSPVGSVYFMQPRILKSVQDQPASALTAKKIIWDGKDQNLNFGREGTYVARVWLKDQATSDINPNPSIARFSIDNTSITYEPVTMENPLFSPQNSPGIKDTTSIGLTPNKNVNYDFTVQKTTGITSESSYRVTNHEARDIAGDIVMDEDFNIYTVYASIASGDWDIYLKVAKDYSFTFGTERAIINSPNKEDQPSIAYYNSTLWVVFMRYREWQTAPGSYVYDLYLTKSFDKGVTWSTPQNITTGEFANPGYWTNYYNPDLRISANGVLYVGFHTYCPGLYINEWQTINSTDGGLTFSTPITIQTASTSSSSYSPPISIEYVDETGTLYAAVGNYYSDDFQAQIYNSTDGGYSWNSMRNISDYGNHYIFGISLFYIENGEFRLDYYGQYSTSIYLFSFDFWISGDSSYIGASYMSMESTVDYRNVLRSGTSPYGDYFLVYSQTISGNADVYLKSRAKSVYHKSGLLFKDTPSVLTWDGSTFWGEAESSNYTIQVSLSDDVGYSAIFERNCTVDNNIPELDLDTTSFGEMTPLSAQLIQSESYWDYDGVDFSMDLYYRNDSTADWTIIPMQCYYLFGYSYIFNATIPADTEANQIYFYGNVSDAAGNTYITPIYSYYEPGIGFQIQDLSAILMKSSWDPFDLTVKIDTGQLFIEKMYVEYIIDSITYQVELDALSPILYSLTTISHTVKPDSIAYRLYVNYTNDKSEMLYNIPLTKPSITFSIFNLLEVTKKSSWDPFAMTVLVETGGQYIQNMYVQYLNNSILTQQNLTNVSTTQYDLPTINHLIKPDAINYSLFVTFVNGQTIFSTNISLVRPNLAFSVIELTAASTYDAFNMKVQAVYGDEYVEAMFVDYSYNQTTNRVNFNATTAPIYILPTIDITEYIPTINYLVWATLTNGSDYLISNITLTEPRFTLAPESMQVIYGSNNTDRRLDEEIQFAVGGLETKYIDKVYLDYAFDGESTYTTKEMSLINGTTFATDLPGSQQHSKLEYQIRLVDIRSRTHVLRVVNGSDAILQDYVPPMPQITLSANYRLYISLGSSVAGLVMSVFYVVNRRKNSARIRDRFMGSLGTRDLAQVATVSDIQLKDRPGEISTDTKQSKDQHKKNVVRSRTSYTLGSISTYLALGFATCYILVEQMLIDINEGIYNEKKPKKIGIFFHVLVTAVSLIIFMLSGQLIDWFNYYVIQQTVALGPIEIPRLWVSLFSVFITSVVLVILSTYKDLNAVMKRFEILALTRTNWKVIWQQKEENVARLNTNAGIKTLVFLATVFISVITTTQLGQYAEVGIVFLAPALIILIMVVLFEMIFGKRTQSVNEVLDSWLIEKTKFCPECQTVNLFDNIYCIKCKHPFALADVVVEKTIRCPKCNNVSPEESEFCRYCGEPVKKHE